MKTGSWLNVLRGLAIAGVLLRWVYDRRLYIQLKLRNYEPEKITFKFALHGDGYGMVVREGRRSGSE